MSRTFRILIVAVIAAVAVGGYWKLALAPKRAEAAELEKQVAVKQAELAQTQGLIATYEGARDAYKSNYSKVVNLGKAVPSDDDTRSLVVQLDAAAKRSGVEFDTINVNGSSGAAAVPGTATLAPGAINAGALSAMPVSFSFSGEFGSLGRFFSRLERFVSLKGEEIAVSGRLMRVESITLVPGDDGWPSLVAQVGASSYIVPEPGEATAAGPEGDPSTTTTTAAAAANAGSDLR